MSTFIDGDGINEIDKVMIQLDYRYMLFDTNGNFLDQIDFTCDTPEHRSGTSSPSGLPVLKDNHKKACI